MSASKFAIFKDDLVRTVSLMPGGSPRYRKYRDDTALRIADGIRATGMMPTRLKNLKPEAIIKLVYYWKRKKLQPETIKNKLSVLRMIVKKCKVDLVIPSNSELNIKVKTYKVKQPSFKKITPNEIDYPLLSDFFWMEYLFGFKKIEALKYRFLPTTKVYTGETYLNSPRNISYNRLDRGILIVTDQQREFIERYNEKYAGNGITNKKTFRALSLFHDAVLESHGIKHADYFRHQYIINRYFALLESGVEKSVALKTVSRETGYATPRQVVEILKMLKKL